MMDDRAEHALDVIGSRHSHRKYKPDPVPRDVIEKIVNAGRLAATARNVQPWHFVVVTDEKMRKRLVEINDYGDFIAEAPVCIVVLCEDTKYYLEDGSVATQNILLAAEALGLGACWVAGDKKPYADKIVKLVGAPGNKKLVSQVAVGYSADTAERRPKRPLNDVLHWEKF
jgi:nitroreductase